MHTSPAKKALFAGAIAAAIVAVTAAAAFANPVLQPGQTSAPGMSGTCTDCHTYAKPASTAAPIVKPKPKPKATVVSHPYVTAGVHRAGRVLKAWGFVSPRLPKGTQGTTMTITVQQSVKGSWVATSSLGTTATVANKGKFAHRTNYTDKLTIGQAGLYRLRAKLVWRDAKGVEHTKWSKPLVIKVHK
jgi:hypothetical protein